MKSFEGVHLNLDGGKKLVDGIVDGDHDHYDLGSEAVAKLKEFNPDKAKAFDGVPGWMLVMVRTEHLDDDVGISAKLALEDHTAAACSTLNFTQSMAEDDVGSKWTTGAL